MKIYILIDAIKLYKKESKGLCYIRFRMIVTVDGEKQRDGMERRNRMVRCG